ncbi:MAG: ABC transporter ATP-binding protein [Candidatus Heimdallarchaeota archaeon]|nr:ABC transporter ATP-binding protein [Candidatus Heimdallarchaeota archaeon]
MSDHANVCTLSNVYKTIDQFEILRDVSLKIKQGRVLALLGPNGAGKTTTIRVILGLLKPTSGEVNVLDIDVTQHPEKIRSKIGLLPQSNAGYKSLTGRDNIEFILKLVGKSAAEYSSDLYQLLDRLNLLEVAEKKWSVLSGGEQRALGFIRAILMGEDILILDEPTTGLDLARAAIIRKIIQEQVRGGKTVVMSSHIITDLEELAEDIVIMKNGKIVRTGSREDILNYYTKDGDLEDALVVAFEETE